MHTYTTEGDRPKMLTVNLAIGRSSNLEWTAVMGGGVGRMKADLRACILPPLGYRRAVHLCAMAVSLQPQTQSLVVDVLPQTDTNAHTHMLCPKATCDHSHTCALEPT